jgi:hypothetical protein
MKLPAEIKRAATRAYGSFCDNPAHPSLHLERLRADTQAWSVRVTLKYRAVAIRSGDNWTWIWIGEHDDFDRKFPA